MRDKPHHESVVPGVLLCLGLFTLSYLSSGYLDRTVSGFQPFSSVVLAILFGILVANVFKPPAHFKAGVSFCVRTVLRAGIVLIGLRLSLAEVGQLGALGLPVVVVTIMVGVVGIEMLGRALGLPARLAMLMAAGTSICGITAVVSTAPVIRAEERDVAYAVANVTLFGLVATLVYPYLVPSLFSDGRACGLFLGTAIHDTSQMMGAAATYKELYSDEVGFATATITKMTRNMFLALVVPYFAWRSRNLFEGEGPGEPSGKRPPVVPLFLLGFLLMSALRTVGDLTLTSAGKAFFVLGDSSWIWLLELLGKTVGSTWFIGLALVGVGLGLRAETFRGLGIKPFILGFAGALLLGLTSFVTITFLLNLLH